MSWRQDWNDRTSSIKVKKGYEVILFEHNNYKGDSTIIKRGYSNFNEIGWNDNTSSIKLRRILNK